ncbi:hypothetical protein BLNAU_7143 [Blattamonas nauphoetae]|uniref:Uncharacterized protein n=1 Tax=Blattamonas nauphoetae TaxID=2049346 RepID=A0ABQ9Y2J0_9EUKA|nr:hypothetical protein BLNAU_7143 [Blattamonas nauphoetae]
MGHSSSSQSKSTPKSPVFDEPPRDENTPARLVSLPRLLIVDPSHFIVDRSTITRSTLGLNTELCPIESPLFIEKTITEGVVSITITILSLSASDSYGDIRFGLLDSTVSFSSINNSLYFRFDRALGRSLLNSVAITSYNGCLKFTLPSSKHNPEWQFCHYALTEGDCVRMEVDMDSTPRKVQFFVNGKDGGSYVSGLPPSVKIGFSVSNFGLSFRIDRITQHEHPTPITPEMKEIRWN